MKTGLKVEGLKEFQRSLKELDSDLPKVLRMAFNEASEMVADDARGRVPRRSGKARGSIKASSTRTMARIKGGGARAPYYPWLDFGGQIGNKSGRNRGRRGKRPWLGEHGRYLFKSYVKFRDSGELADATSDALIKVAKTAGLDVTRG